LLTMGADLSEWRVVGAVARAEQGVFEGMPDWPDWVVALHTSADSKPEQMHNYLGCSVLFWIAMSLIVSAATSVVTSKLPMHRECLQYHNIFGGLLYSKLFTALHQKSPH
jgi:hypothetical protein